jgi:hypothetical protein
MRRSAAEGQKWVLLLAALLEGHVTDLSRYAQFRWVLPPPNVDDASAQNPTSSFCQEGYVYPGLGALHQGTFIGTEAKQPMRAVEAAEYYTRFGREVESSLEIPSNIDTLLGRFFALSVEDRDSFLRSCYWLSHAEKVFPYSHSAMFMALISAIEALIRHEKPITKCPTCQRDISKGAKRRLGDFLDQYAPHNAKFNAARAELYYQFRSSLSHGGELSYSDRTGYIGLAPAAAEERTHLNDVWFLVKVVLINWLHSHAPLVIPAYRGPGIRAV